MRGMNRFLLWYPYPSARTPLKEDLRVLYLPVQAPVRLNKAATVRPSALPRHRALTVAADALRSEEAAAADVPLRK